MKDIIFPITYKSDEKGLKVAEAQLSGFGTIAAGAFAAIGVAAVQAFATASRAVADFTIESVKAASSFTETTAAVEQVFGENAKQLEDFAKTASSTIGQSRTQFLQAAKTFGIFGKAAGLAGAENADFSTTLTTLATDLASFNDTSIDESITAIGAALRGESEPIRRFGVLLDDATLKARAMEMGIYDGSGSLTQQQRVLSAYQEILAQTTTQQGDFARTSDGLANGSRTLQAVWENLQITVGEALLPALEKVLPQFVSFIEAMVASPEFNTFLADMATNFENVLNYLPTALENLQSFGKDALPAIEAFFPFVNDALYLMGSAFGVISSTDPSSNTRTFAGAIQELANGMNDLGDAFKWVGDMLNWITTTFNTLPGWVKLILGGGSAQSLKNIQGLYDAIQSGNIGVIRNFLGVPNLSGVPDVPLTPRGRLVGQATGGETTRSGLSWVGERGPELLNLPTGAQVIPLGKIPSGGGNSTFNISINAGMGADGAALGEQIVTAIRKYERTSGAVFAKA